MSYTLQCALESGQDARIVQIDFSAAFHWVNHRGILYKLSSVYIISSGFVYIDKVSIKPITARYVDSCQSKVVIVASGVQ